MPARIARQAFPSSTKKVHVLTPARNEDVRLRAALRAYRPAVDVAHLSAIAIVGAANEGMRLVGLCRDQGVEVVAMVDDHPAKVGTKIADRVVEPVSALARIDRTVPVVIASHRVLGAADRLRELGFTSILPFGALQAMAPQLYPPHMFYDGLLDDLSENEGHYQWLRDVLADARSRDVLDAVLTYRQTFDPLAFKPVLDDDDLYAPKRLFEFADDEVYVDGGSYDGDTIRSFIERVRGRFADVYAFEPDPVTFQALTDNFRHEPRVHPIHAGLYSRAGQLRFRDDASRGAIFATDGDIDMPVTTIDETLGQRRPTYIKMNIEGAEIEALKGGRNVIGQWAPRLAISVYHRPSDLWRIPQLVLELNAGYDLYLRQHDGGIIETVLYALPRGMQSGARG